jgi:subtilase family protein
VRPAKFEGFWLGAVSLALSSAEGGDDKPHQHGTAMAGAIAAHGKLVGIAPRAQLLAARAFDDASTRACNGRPITAPAS